MTNSLIRRHSHLQNSSEFRVVYAHGRRYEGRFLTAFIYPNNLAYHRLGITASRKTSRSAVERNRLKRLLREAFRLSEDDLSGLRARYDWVLNARRALLQAKVAAPLEELKRIIVRVAHDECIHAAVNNTTVERKNLNL